MAATAVPSHIDSFPSTVNDQTVLGRISGELRSIEPKTDVCDDPDAPSLEDLNFRLEPSERPGSLGRLHKYEVLEIIGKGGCGIVLRAFEETLQRMVAIKVMLAEMSMTSPARKRFLREGRSSAAIRDDHVVQIYAVEEKPIPYLVMEFIPGESLQQRIERNGPLEVYETLKIGRQIAQGLAAAHAMGIVHRDIKPANILIENHVDTRVKITDFGMARTADDASLTQTGMVAGTPMYMAPEQARGEKVDHRSDLFSLGSVLYVMITGRAPFRASNLLAVIQRVAQDEPRDIREIIPETPDWLCALIGKLHAKTPSERFQSAAEVADLLGKCITAIDAKENPAKYLPFVKENRPKFGSPAVLGGLALSLFAAITCGYGYMQSWFSTPPVVAAVGVANVANPADTEPNPETKPVEPTSINSFDPESQKPFTNRLGMKLVHVPTATFWYGDNRYPLTQDFYMGAYEVTLKQWQALMGKESPTSDFTREGAHKDRLEGLTDEEIDKLPVCKVSWDSAQTFLNRLNQFYGEKGWRYRLPSFHEWRGALCGGLQNPDMSGRFRYYGAEPIDTLTPAMANVLASGLNRPAPVGSYPPNALGIFDMHGNVFEWMNDTVDPERANLVGGCFIDSIDKCEFGFLAFGMRNMCHEGGGLRVALVRE